MPTLIVVDDEPNVLYSLERSLKSDSLKVVTAPTARQGIEAVRQAKPDVVLLDVRLPDMSGLEAFDQIQTIDSRLPVIMMTAYATAETAIEATKRGAFEYLLKPVDLHELRQAVTRAIEFSHMAHVPAVFDEAQANGSPGESASGEGISGEGASGEGGAGTSGPPHATVDPIVGRSAAMQEVYKAIGRIAPLEVNVLLLGESGTGKELVARAIYHHSPRSTKPFLAINCAAIPDTLLESELFGYERGAFTGANHLRIGKFEQADGGTILLDEIGDMSGATQAKVLRVLQDQTFQRLGGTKTIRTDVRVLAATNQNLEQLVADARFRQDLYYRLKVCTITIPPLRGRLEDLPALVDHFVKRYSRELGKTVRGAAPQTLALLTAHAWPGNVRELQSIVKAALVNARGDWLTPDCLPDEFRVQPKDETESPPPKTGRRLDVSQLVRRLIDSQADDIYRKVLSAVDRVVLEEVLIATRGNQVEASQLLGISRTTLRAKMQALGLSVEKQVLPESDHPDQTVNNR